MSNPPTATTSALVTSSPSFFDYQAQTEDGQRLTGTIEAPDAEGAMSRLQSMRLRVIEVWPATSRPRGKALRGDDFRAFNQQLAQLTAAGLPVEQGLRLIAADMRRGRLTRTIEQLASELESGTPLDQAIEKYRGKFPPLYGQLIGAGIKSGNLSAVLLSLGRHLGLVQRLRSVVWRAVSYPLFVLIAVGFLLSFLGIAVLPQFASIYAGFNIKLPFITQMLLGLGRAAPALLIVLLAVVLGGPITWRVLQWLGVSGRAFEWFVLPVPLIGPVLRTNLVARWCDGARVGVEAGLDLPAAIKLAGDATASRRLSDDGNALIDALSAGRPLTAAATSLMPATVPAAMQFASGHQDLAATLNSLSDMYQRQAEQRLNAIPGILTPLLLVFIAVVIGFIIFALFAPFVTLLNWTGGGLKL